MCKWHCNCLYFYDISVRIENCVIFCVLRLITCAKKTTCGALWDVVGVPLENTNSQSYPSTFSN